ncbi:zeta toxin family protein [Nostoc sp. FACHB-87]|uniref:zeta toxin family protein n=1 Tax=Nostocales TaxID=1161 RepID=UPI001681F0FC|nr:MULTISPECIES: zeta toxin family protein [Nostocales]MBD2298106.1 zeta toxin family protein [Nostoc sp. FACHB-190]MBD2454001.1 zeta toxin family protein [Nostoc sp. FACHB-87]MBD2476304.1 zeta toxin family protein [Anabaena sp. FACHB-83]MBD2489480.1 zeta toxin family protein [Aulosira sp. FACHB-615]
MPNLYIIGGANGSGKTTVAMSLLPNFLDCFEYVNADSIAAGLSPLNPDSMAIEAGKLMITRLQTLSNSGSDFAFETTLSARTFVPFINECKNKGYTVNLIYFWLRSVDLAIERVAQRVTSGGHSIPEEVIRRRYERGKKNLISLYLPLCDRWIIYDNSSNETKLVAEYRYGEEVMIYENAILTQIRGDKNG